MLLPTEAISVADEFAFVEQETFDRFERVGYGPLVVQRSALLRKIINTADPMTSLHISGCKGAGKTTVLNLVGRHLSQQKENEIYFFLTASEFNREKVIQFVKALIKSKRPAYLLVDETQANPSAALFVPLLKNTNKHNITVIGAGVPQFDSMSGDFVENITTDQLFLINDAMLESENIFQFFSKGTTTQYQAHEVKLLLSRIRAHVGGHIYPFMWLSERLVPDILAGKSANETFQSIFDSTFRESDDFKRMTSRILPRVSVDVFRTLFTLNPPASTMKDLRRYGFCDQDNKVISQLLFDAYALSLKGTTPFQGRLGHGVAGVQQLLTFALPSINWEHYNAHGGPIEDAITFELLLILSRVAHLGTRLFNPKLVNVAAGRKPDLYLNTSVDA